MSFQSIGLDKVKHFRQIEIQFYFALIRLLQSYMVKKKFERKNLPINQ